MTGKEKNRPSGPSAAVLTWGPGPAVAILLAAVLLLVPLGAGLELLFRLTGAEPPGKRPLRVLSARALEVMQVPTSLDFGRFAAKGSCETPEEQLASLVATCELQGVGPPARLYLREAALDTFTDQGMVAAGAKRLERGRPDFAFEGASSAEALPCSATLTFYRNLDPILPHLPTLGALRGPLEYEPRADGSVRLAATIAASDRFVMATALQPARGEDEPLLTLPPGHELLRVEPLASQPLEELARTVAPAGASLEERLRRLVQFIQTSCRCSLSPPRRAPELHPTVEFLLHTREGHCQHVATAVTLLCRLLGIGARVAVGLVATPSSQEPRLFLATTCDGHAWVEVLTARGFAVLDVAVPGGEASPAGRRGRRSPARQELARRLAEARKANEQAGSGLYEEAPAEGLPEGEGLVQRASGGPPRIANKQWRERPEADSAPPPAADPLRTRRRLLLAGLAALLALALLAEFRFKAFTRLAQWLLRAILELFSTKSPEPASRQPPEGLGELAARVRRFERELDAAGVVELFNQLSAALEEACDLGRLENETPREYVARSGAALRLEAGALRVLEEVFCAAFYGQKGISAGQLAQFRETVLRVVETARERG